MSNNPTGKRTCATTGLPVCLDAEFFRSEEHTSELQSQ